MTHDPKVEITIGAPRNIIFVHKKCDWLFYLGETLKYHIAEDLSVQDI